MAAEWHEIVHRTPKANDVRLVTYVPDKVRTGLAQSHWAADEADYERLVARARRGWALAHRRADRPRA